MSKVGHRHLIKCRCFLHQLKNAEEIPPHHFVVFSVIDEDGEVIPKFAQCNNCGIVHKVIDICKSHIMNGRENLNSVITIDEIKDALPEKLVTILEKYKVDISGWEQAQFIIEEKQWGNFVILAQDTIDGIKQGKIVKIIGESLFKLEAFASSNYIEV
jgi:regulator of RNase E activity RraB